MPASTYHNASWYCIAGGCPATMAKESRDPEIGVASTGPGTGQGRAGLGALHDHARPLRLPVLHEGGSDDNDDAPGAPTAQGAPECARRGPRNHVITTRRASKQNLQKIWEIFMAIRFGTPIDVPCVKKCRNPYMFKRPLCIGHKQKQEAQLSPRDRAMRRVS